MRLNRVLVVLLISAVVVTGCVQKAQTPPQPPPEQIPVQPVPADEHPQEPMVLHPDNTMHLDNVRVEEIASGNTGLMWRYDETRLAYALNGDVFLLEEFGVSIMVRDLPMPVVWADTDLMVLYDWDAGGITQLLYGDRSVVLRTQYGAFRSLAVDGENLKFYYITMECQHTGIAVVDLRTMDDAQIVTSSHDSELTSFALSPDHKSLIFVTKTAEQTVGPERYVHEFYLLRLDSGRERDLELQRIEVEFLFADYEYNIVHWAIDDILFLRESSMWPGMGRILLLCSIDPDGTLSLQVRRPKTVSIYTDDLKKFILGDLGDGCPPLAHIWHYDTDSDETRLINNLPEWAEQWDEPLAYHDELQLLFISRHRVCAEHSINHGVLLDLDGREYLLLSDVGAINQAVWIGSTLYVRTPSRVLRITFDKDDMMLND